MIGWTAAPIVDLSGRDLVLVCGLDLTERYRYEEELRASRRRIVQAGDEERRRLERNLHDGAQQRLVALALTVRMVERKSRATRRRRAGCWPTPRTELDQALAELREIARGLHPAVLTDRGLGPALDALATRAPIPVDVARAIEARLPAPVEAAAYYVVAEALTNVAKYAQASEARSTSAATTGACRRGRRRRRRRGGLVARLGSARASPTASRRSAAASRRRQPAAARARRCARRDPALVSARLRGSIMLSPGVTAGILMTELTDFGAIVVVAGIAFVAAVLAAKVTARVPVPTPALFLVAAAIASGTSPRIENRHSRWRTVERIAVIALIVILLNGGMNIGWRGCGTATPVVSLGVLGTFLTAALIAVVAHGLLGFTWTLAGIVGAALAPTDPAVMFSVLGGTEIQGRAGTILEGERAQRPGRHRLDARHGRAGIS